MMNILVVSNMYPSEQKPYSGLFVVNQVEAIKKKLSNDDILDFYYMKRTFTGKIGSTVKYLKFFFNFIRFVTNKNIKYDIIHIHYYFPTIYTALIYKYLFHKKVKVIVTFHGFDLYRTQKNFLFKYPLNYVDACIGVSSKMCDGIAVYYQGELYNISAGIHDMFKKYNVKKEYDIIFVGSFYEEKGFDRLCKYLLTTKDILKVCIVGSGYLEKNMHDVIQKTSHKIDIYNNLKQEEIVFYLNKSKILLNLSREESFGLSMTEAMICGTPVIATITDGSLEQIKNYENGVLLQSNQIDELSIVEELSFTVHTLLFKDSTILAKMSKKALKDSQKYKLENVSNEIIQLYKKVIK